MPATAIAKSIATPSLLSQIITCKYQFGLPLYRQETLFANIEIELSRQTMSSWMLRCAQLLSPLYQRLKEVLLSQAVIHGDETPLQVINADKATSYMWVYCCGDDKAVKGRNRSKNWLFSNTSKGAHASAILYSLVETAKANDIMVHDYISMCLQYLAKKPDNIDMLLPWNIKHS